MKTFLYLIIAALIVYCALYLALSFRSQKQVEVGLLNGLLRPCPDTPNCVCSEFKDTPSYIEPITYTESANTAWQEMQESITELGGKIEKQTDNYIWATFTTNFWHFVYDVELRLDAPNRVIQVRSASRVGKGDMGMNRKRVEQLRTIFNKHRTE